MPHLDRPTKILLVLAFLGAIAATALHFVHTPQATLTHLNTALLPTSTKFKTDTILLNANHTEDALYLAETVRIDNQLKVPVYIDDLTVTFTDKTGAQLQTAAFQKQDLANLQITFPALKPMLQTPLLRETKIDPGQSLTGTVLFSYPLTEPAWKDRKSATLQVTFYHQPSATLTIPN